MKKYCLGIDIGGTSIKSGLFDRQGVLLEKWSIPTRIEENGKHIIGDIKDSTDRKLESLGLDPGQLSGAGVGVPGQVSRQGEVLFAENLGWYHVPLTEELTRRLGMPVRTENDANLAALGEMWKGSGQPLFQPAFCHPGNRHRMRHCGGRQNPDRSGRSGRRDRAYTY